MCIWDGCVGAIIIHKTFTTGNSYIYIYSCDRKSQMLLTRGLYSLLRAGVGVGAGQPNAAQGWGQM